MNIAQMQRFKQMQREIPELQEQIKQLMERIAVLENKPKPGRPKKE